ncbi:hypothetical protein BU23DRAFT_549656 [Bimuria novae-zelandiae CBS 107.79]|uniref:Uncharacterized protein n=1 Tax=Bimuria novae-zelandiae CBS 107.79 TaxID=1447943 RepID=A0A6A5VQX1_9PLEO|nr:hypothetical protein BU23DRAFT_549656 [Bimuria novae-zelandiae CBS 107.79]
MTESAPIWIAAFAAAFYSLHLLTHLHDASWAFFNQTSLRSWKHPLLSGMFPFSGLVFVVAALILDHQHEAWISLMTSALAIAVLNLYQASVLVSNDSSLKFGWLCHLNSGVVLLGLCFACAFPSQRELIILSFLLLHSLLLVTWKWAISYIRCYRRSQPQAAQSLTSLSTRSAYAPRRQSTFRNPEYYIEF